MADETMDVGTALDLARALVNKFARPLLRLEEILDVAATATAGLPAAEQRTAALTAEYEHLTDLVTQARARADGATEESARIVAAAKKDQQAIAAEVAGARQQADKDMATARQRATEAGRALGLAHEQAEATLAAQLAEKQRQVAALEARLAALKAQAESAVRELAGA
jgi:chromosome segregation ATPase